MEWVRTNVLKGFTENVTNLAVFPDGRVVMAGVRDTTVRVWSPEGSWLKSNHTGLAYEL